MRLYLRCLLVWAAAGAAFADGVDPAALDRLVERARETSSDALVVLHDGETVGAWSFGKPEGPIEAMSVTKSIVALAIGKLIDEGKIASIDTPVHEFYPQWKQGRKQRITLRHLLDHTSGLQNVSNTGVEIYPSPDFVELALAAELSDDPGEVFAYNNKAVNLLAGVVRIAAGKRMDVYIGEAIFAPLGITDFGWTLDRAGNPHAMAGLQIRATDLARLGQLVLDRGTWQGRRILSEAWIEAMTTPRDVGPFAYARPCGFLWWLTPEWERTTIDAPLFAIWREAGVDEAFLAKIAPLAGRVWEREDNSFFADVAELLGGEAQLETWYDNTWRRGLPDSALLRGPIAAYSADGYLGQYVVVVPRARIVAVRQKRAPATDEGAERNDAFGDFVDYVRALAGEP